MKILCFLKNYKKHILCFLGASIVCLTTFIFATQGLNRPNHFHPDEYNISRWAPEYLYTGHINSRVYPEGLYVFSSPILKKIEKKQRKDDGVSWWEQGTNEPWITKNRLVSFNPHRFTLPFRWINASILVMATLSFFVLILLIFKSITLATLGGLLLGCNSLLIEHTHYAESDIVGMLFVLLTICTICWSLKKDSWLALFLGAFLSGFAFSCKFSNSPLIILLVFLILYKMISSLRVKPKCLNKKTIISLAILCLLCIFIGVIIGLPHVYINYDSFIKSAQYISKLTYAELNGILGEIRNEPFARTLTNLAWLKNTLLKFGMFFWFMWCASIFIILCSKKYRIYIVPFVCFPIFYVIFAVFQFPFIRDQEIIPILPFILFAILIFAKFGLEQFKLKKSISICCLILFLCLAVNQISCGIKMSSTFGHPDTSTLFAKWINTHVSPEYKIFCEPYSINVNLLNNAENYGYKVETDKENKILKNFDLIVRSPKQKSRGVFNPITFKRFPQFENIFNNFIQNASLATSIDHLENDGPVFGALPLELWCVNKSLTVTNNFEKHTNKYINLISGGEIYYVSPNNNLYKVYDCLRLVNSRSKIKFALNSNQKYWAIARLEYAKGPQKIEWDSFFSPRTTIIQPGHTQFFSIDEFAWLHSLVNIWPSCKVRMKADEGTSLAWVYVTDNPYLVIKLLEETQDYQEISRFKTENNISDEIIRNSSTKLVDTILFNNLNYKNLVLLNHPENKNLFCDLPCILGPGKYKFSFMFVDEEMIDNELEIIDLTIRGANSSIKTTNLIIKNNKVYSEVELDVEVSKTDRFVLQLNSNSRNLKTIKKLRIY